MRPVRVKKRAVVVALVGCTVVLVFFIFVGNLKPAHIVEIDPTIQFLIEEEELAAVSEQKEALACRRKKLPLFNNPEVDHFFSYIPKLECSKDGEVDWVVTRGSEAYVRPDIMAKYGPTITCYITELLRKDEFNTVTGKTTRIQNDEVYVFKGTDYVDVQCHGSSGTSFKSFLAAPRNSIQIPELDNSIEPKTHSPLNVLIWGQDSLSRLTYMRKLPKTWKYISQELNPIVLRGYNIIGDGTPQALIPMLTGKTETELPEARAEMGDRASFVDVYPFIWNEFEDRGYLTGFLEDQPTLGTFSHRHKGFNRAPTDFYMRTFFLAVDKYLYPVLTKVFSYVWSNFCIANTPAHKVMMNYFTNIVQTYSKVPKFLFAFRGEQSHNDLNAIQGADDDLRDFFKGLKESNALNNSILIVMSDHGARFQSIRETIQGKFEERLPMFAFIFPPWFQSVYPHAYSNFKNNSNRLVTPFDIHETLQDIYQLGLEMPDVQFMLPNDRGRAMSLFKKIPPTRTCVDAQVEPHWCACLDEETLLVSHPLVKRAADAFVETLNKMTEPHRTICQPLVLKAIMSASKLLPSKAFLKFQYSADKDGRVPDMRGSTKIKNVNLQLRLATAPNDGHYEVTMAYNKDADSFTIKESDISRTNKYGSQADCVANVASLSYLRKYCYCR